MTVFLEPKSLKWVAQLDHSAARGILNMSQSTTTNF